MTETEEILWSVAVVNWGAGPYVREVWGVKPDGPDSGSMHWPREERDTPVPLTADESDWDFSFALNRIAELQKELSWVVMA